MVKMSSEITVKNTLAFRFPGDAAQPAVEDMVLFVKALNGDKSMMETAYKISDEKSVFIRFRSAEAMQFVLANNAESLPFHFNNGTKTMVRMSVAGNTRYVRIFDLPPEVEDADLVLVLQKYGKVQRTVRERFPAEFQLDMFTGVRGVYMDIESAIPDALYFRNRKGRIFYHGIKPRCFICKSDKHLIKSCPISHSRKGSPPKPMVEEKPAENVTAACVDEESGREDEVIVENQQKKKKMETKRQRSFGSDRESDTDACKRTQKKKQPNNPSSSESECSLISVPDNSQRMKHRIATYEWITDANERRLLIEEDKMRIAAASNTPVEQIDFYHD